MSVPLQRYSCFLSTFRSSCVDIETENRVSLRTWRCVLMHFSPCWIRGVLLPRIIRDLLYLLNIQVSCNRMKIKCYLYKYRLWPLCCLLPSGPGTCTGAFFLLTPQPFITITFFPEPILRCTSNSAGCISPVALQQPDTDCRLRLLSLQWMWFFLLCG